MQIYYRNAKNSSKLHEFYLQGNVSVNEELTEEV